MADAGDDDMVGPRVRVPALLAGQDRNRRSPRLLGAPMGSGHHLAQSARDHGAAALREQPPYFLGGCLVVGAAPDHRDLERHRWLGAATVKHCPRWRPTRRW